MSTGITLQVPHDFLYFSPISIVDLVSIFRFIKKMDSETNIFRVSQILKKKSKTFEELQELYQLLSDLKSLLEVMSSLTLTARLQLLSSFTVIELQPNQKLFEKGDPSDCIYVILSGSLQLYNHSSKDKGDKIPGNILGAGTMLGERGILKNLPRSLTGIAVEPMYILRLGAQIFKNLIGKEVNANMETKRKIVDQYIPGLTQYPTVQKERLAYLLEIEYLTRGTILAKQGNYTDKIYIILDGECRVNFQNGIYNKILSTLEKGSFVGEESALFDKPSAYSVIVSSGGLKAAKIRNSDIKSLYPSSTIQLLRNSYNAREISRSKLANFTHPCYTPRPNMPGTPRDFPSATPFAKEKMNTILQRIPHVRSSTLATELHKFNFKSELESETPLFRVRKRVTRCKTQGLF